VVQPELLLFSLLVFMSVFHLFDLFAGLPTYFQQFHYKIHDIDYRVLFVDNNPNPHISQHPF